MPFKIADDPETDYRELVTTPNAEAVGLLGGYPIKSFGHMHAT